MTRAHSNTTRRLERARHGTRGPGRDRGAALIEAAIIAPLFFMLVFGIIEFGSAFYDRLTVQNMSQTGARIGSGAGDDPTADYRILQKIRGTTGAIPTGRITDIAVYRASGPDAGLPTCVDGGTEAVPCNRYTGASLSLAEDEFGCDDSTDADQGWCPTSRNVALNDPPDYLGIYIRAEHPTLTGFFGDEFVFTSNTIMRLEPRRLS